MERVGRPGVGQTAFRRDPVSAGERSRVGASEESAVDIDDVQLAESQLSDADRSGIAAIVGADHVRTGHRDRLLRAGGKSTLDLLRRKLTHQDAPDAVLLPANEDEVAQLLAYCSEHRIAVVPFGGGTTVVGGVDPIRGEFSAVVSVDLRRLNEMHWLDKVSGEAELGAGLTGPDAERACSARKASPSGTSRKASASPPSAATPSLAPPGGTRPATALQRDGPRNASGHAGRRTRPGSGTGIRGGADLRQLVAGSEGTFGIVTRVRIRVHPTPENVRYEAWSFPDFSTGAAALRAVTQTGTGPTVLRLSDEMETGVNLAKPESIGEQQITGGCLAITLFEGTPAHTESRHAETPRRAGSARRHILGEAPARHGSTAVSTPRICGIRCWLRARCARRSRRRPRGRTSRP